MNFGNYSSWLEISGFCANREERESLTNIRDFTTLFYVVLRRKSSEWLLMCVIRDVLFFTHCLHVVLHVRIIRLRLIAYITAYASFTYFVMQVCIVVTCLIACIIVCITEHTVPCIRCNACLHALCMSYCIYNFMYSRTYVPCIFCNACLHVVSMSYCMYDCTSCIMHNGIYVVARFVMPVYMLFACRVACVLACTMEYTFLVHFVMHVCIRVFFYFSCTSHALLSCMGSFCEYRSTDYVSLHKTKEIKDRKQYNSK